MSYLYGDSTPSKLEVQLHRVPARRGGVRCAGAAGGPAHRAGTRAHADARARDGRGGGAAAEAGAAGGEGVRGHVAGRGRLRHRALRGGDPRTRRAIWCAPRRSRCGTRWTPRSPSATRRPAQERDGCVKALEALVGQTRSAGDGAWTCTWRSRRRPLRGPRAHEDRFRSGRGMDLEVPADHLFERVVRVDRLHRAAGRPGAGGRRLAQQGREAADAAPGEAPHRGVLDRGQPRARSSCASRRTAPARASTSSSPRRRRGCAWRASSSRTGRPTSRSTSRTTTPRSCSPCTTSWRRRRSSWPATGGGWSRRGSTARRCAPHAKPTVLVERLIADDGAGRAGDLRAFAVAGRAGAPASAQRRSARGDLPVEVELKAEARAAAGRQPRAVRSAVGERGRRQRRHRPAGEGRATTAPDRRGAAAGPDDPVPAGYAVDGHAAARHLDEAGPPGREIGRRRAPTPALDTPAGGRPAPDVDRRDGGVGGAERRRGDNRCATRAAPCARGASRIGDAAAAGIGVEDAARRSVPPGHPPQRGGRHHRRQATSAPPPRVSAKG